MPADPTMQLITSKEELPRSRSLRRIKRSHGTTAIITLSRPTRISSSPIYWPQSEGTRPPKNPLGKQPTCTRRWPASFLTMPTIAGWWPMHTESLSINLKPLAGTRK